jgi:SAM-dependent methyltransferase
MALASLLDRIDRTISPRDGVHAGFAAAGPDVYFTRTLAHLEIIDSLVVRGGGPALAGCARIADYASHFGRITRALRVVAPAAEVFACDVDADAVDFCAKQFGARPVTTGWRPDEDPTLPGDVDLVICFSLLTHVDAESWRRLLAAWRRMLAPGGAIAFTYLDEPVLARWLAGELPYYGDYSDAHRARLLRDFAATGFGYAPIPGAYGGDGYGITFTGAAWVRAAVEAAGLVVVELQGERDQLVGQQLAVVRGPER